MRARPHHPAIDRATGRRRGRTPATATTASISCSTGEIPTSHFDQLADAIQDGHASVKIFTTNIFPGSGGQLMMPHGHIWETLKVVARQGGIACIHAEDNDIVMFMYDKLMRENRVNFEHMAEVHNTLTRGAFLQSRDPAGRECRGRGALHGACLGGDRRRGTRCVARPRLPDVRRNPAPVPDVQRRGLQAPGRADVSHLSVAEVSRGPEAALGSDQPRRHPGHRHRRAVLPVARQAAGQPDRRHDRRQCRRRAAGRR